MAIYLSAGHHNSDPGAVRVYKGITYKEADITKVYRDKTYEYIMQFDPNAKVFLDRDSETLSQYLNRIKPGYASVVMEYHINAGPLNKEGANGVEVVVPENASNNDTDMAKEFVNNFKVCGMATRRWPVIKESQTARGRLAIMRKPGIVNLVEIGFMTNDEDLEMMNDECFIDKVCMLNAKTLIKFDALI